MPWIALVGGCTDQSAILDLDYVYAMSPVVFYKSLRNRHFMVTLILGTALLLKILIILSTSLFFHGSADTVLSVPVQILNSFAAPTNLTILDASPYYVAKSINDLGSQRVRAVWRSIRVGLASVTVSQALTFLSGFPTSLSSVLFTAQTVPKSDTVKLQQGTWFGNVTNITELGSYLELVEGLLLRQEDTDSTFPTNTYDTLVFPVLKGLVAPDGVSNVSALAKTPAVQLVPDCVVLDPSAYTVEQEKTCVYTCKDGYYYRHVMKENITCSDGTNVTIKNIFNNATSGNSWDTMAYFGELVESPADPIDLLCPGQQDGPSPRLHGWHQETYAWGSFFASSGNISFFTAMRCNYSWADVDVDLTLVSADFIIDSDNPPQVIQNSSKPHTPIFPIPDLHGYTTGISVFPPIDMYTGLSAQFRLLVEPSGPVALESLGSEDHVDEILTQLTHDFTMAAGLIASRDYRLLINQTSISPPYNAPDLETVPVTIYVSIYDLSRRRLVQNPVPTYILLCILCLIVLVNAWALASRWLRKLGWAQRPWMIDMNLQGQAPEEPGTIASQAGLLYESNAIDMIPEGAWYMKAHELDAALHGREFRLGWFQDQRKDKTIFTIGVLGDENMPFLGGKEEVPRMEEREIGDLRMPLSGIDR